MSWKIWHNPKCSKSRQTLELLKEKGVNPEIVEYLKTPPTPEELKALLTQLDVSIEMILRKKEEEFKALDLDLTDESAVLEAISQHPKILERPIVSNGTQAVLGRPPENVLEII